MKWMELIENAKAFYQMYAPPGPTEWAVTIMLVGVFIQMYREMHGKD